MNLNTAALTALSILAVLNTSPAWSTDKARTNAGDNWGQHVQRQAAEPAIAPTASAASVAMAAATSATSVGPQAALFGSPAAATTASRVITLTPDLKYVRVGSGDTVTFKSGAQETTWTFAEFIHGGSADLGILFPAMPNAKGVRIDIDRSKLFTGG